MYNESSRKSSGNASECCENDREKRSGVQNGGDIGRIGLSEAPFDAVIGEEYIVKDIEAEDEELKAFLFSLGCYSGEPITVNSHIKGGCVVSIKDARYNIDVDLARAISI